MVGRLLSYWEGYFSGAMLNFGRVQFLGGKTVLQKQFFYIGGGFLT